MSDLNSTYDNYNSDNPADFKDLLLRFLTFWPYVLISIIIGLVASHISLRYSSYYYETNSTIEILDKAQESEMALPTAMTVFNRSMINLDNEIGRLSSYNLNKTVVSDIESNLRFFDIGNVKNTELHKTQFFNDYSIVFKTDLELIDKKLVFQINILNNRMNIQHISKKGDIIKSHDFNSLSTYNVLHDLPFDLKINDDLNDREITKQIIIDPFRATVERFISMIKFNQSLNVISRNFNSGSDQIDISMRYPNILIAEEYLSKLIEKFDFDGINDRQIEYKRTIDFVNDRSVFLQNELEIIEKRKQDFKSFNKLTDIKSDASMVMNQQFSYDSDLFTYQSQKDLLGLLKAELIKFEYKLLPINFGLLDDGLNNLINKYNDLILNRNNMLSSGIGSRNSTILNLEDQIDNLFQNINGSIKNYEESVDLNISMIYSKEKEFENQYSNIPENEKILRAINRELEIKGSTLSFTITEERRGIY